MLVFCWLVDDDDLELARFRGILLVVSLLVPMSCVPLLRSLGFFFCSFLSSLLLLGQVALVRYLGDWDCLWVVPPRLFLHCWFPFRWGRVLLAFPFRWCRVLWV